MVEYQTEDDVPSKVLFNKSSSLQLAKLNQIGRLLGSINKIFLSRLSGFGRLGGGGGLCRAVKKTLFLDENFHSNYRVNFHALKWNKKKSKTWHNHTITVTENHICLNIWNTGQAFQTLSQMFQTVFWNVWNVRLPSSLFPRLNLRKKFCKVDYYKSTLLQEVGFVEQATTICFDFKHMAGQFKHLGRCLNSQLMFE